MVKLVFVYGLLMRGGEHAGFLSDRRDVRFLGPARCRGALYDLGPCPGLVEKGPAWVAGEIYRCEAIEETLRRLDGIEPEGFFERKVLPVRWRQGPDPAWVHVYAGPLDRAVLIRGGSWKAHMRGLARSGERD